MKKLYFLFILLISATSYGQVLVAEDFNYPDGSLVPNGGWATTSGTAGDLLVSSGEAVVQHGTPSEDVEITFSPITGDIYAGFDFSVDDLGAPYSNTGTDFEYFAHFNFKAQIDIVPPTGSGDYSVGISSDANTAEAVWGTDLTFGTTYRAIIRFNQDTGTAELWINPTMSSDTSIIGSDDGAASVDSFDFRQSDSDENETIRVDDLMIGQTFNDVVTFAAQTNPQLTITSPTNGETLAPGTTSVDVTLSVENFTVGNTPADDGYIEATLVTPTGTFMQDKFDTTPVNIQVADGETFTITMELVDPSGNSLNPAESKSITFSIGSLTPVANISALRASTIGETYELTGEALISYIVTENTRNQKYIQDGAAGILIDDTAGTLSTPLNIGDGITGLKGTLSEFNGVLQFVPSEDLPGASSTGNTITPIDVTAAELASNGENYESQLIRLLNVTFTDTGMFTDNTNYDVTTSGGTDMTVCRVSFGDEDLIGTMIPTVATNITGLGSEFNGTYQIFPRFASDIDTSLSTNEFNSDELAMYPNPAKSGFVTISSSNNDAMNVQVFDILGKQVKKETLTNNTLDVSNLNSGMYLVKITQNNASITKKLVIE